MRISPSAIRFYSVVMLALVASIHDFSALPSPIVEKKKTWMVGTRPIMTTE